MRCNKGYQLKDGKCWAPAVKNCKTQIDIECKECNKGYTLKKNKCEVTKIPYCENQVDTKCLKCTDKYVLDGNKCILIPRIDNCKTQGKTRCFECKPGYSVNNNGLSCKTTPYGKTDNCVKHSGDKCIQCNENFTLDQDGLCEKIPIIQQCENQKAHVCLKCFHGYTLKNNLCHPGDVKASPVLKKVVNGPLERCPPIPECIPGCVDNQGKCIQGICVCNKGFSGNQCEKKIPSTCKIPDGGPIRSWKLKDQYGKDLVKNKFHIYNNTSTPAIPILRTIKNSLGKVMNLLGPDPANCDLNENATCPATGSMTTKELKRWAERLREVREHKRCSPDENDCHKEDSKDKSISVKGNGERILNINAKEGQKEGFSGSVIPSYSVPKMSLGPRRTSNMFGVI